MKHLFVVAALFMSSVCFAQRPEVTVLNDTNKNVRVDYVVCQGDNCNIAGGSNFFYANKSKEFLISLKPDQIARIYYAEEIDAWGHPLQHGARSPLSFCTPKPTQTVHLTLGEFTTRTGATFDCRVE